MTHQAPTYLVLLLGLVAMLTVYLAAWAQLHARVAAAHEFGLLMFAIALYALGYSIELSRTDLVSMLQIIKVEYIGIALIPPLNLLFIIHFVGGKPAPWPIIALVMVIPLITIGLTMTIEYHSLIYINPSVVRGPFFDVIQFTRGPWYYVNLVYLQSLPAVSFFILLIAARKAGPKLRRQILGLATGSFLPILGGFLYFAGLIPGGVDPAPFALSISGIIFAVTLFKFGLFELVPAARELALDSVSDSFLVFDRRHHLQDLNKAATQLPGAQDFVLGAALPPASPLTAHLQPLLDSGTGQAEFSVEFSSEHASADLHSFQAKAYPIQTRPDQTGGVAILIRDITETAGLLRQLNLQANTDALTGLLNRRQLIQMGAVAFENSRLSGLPIGAILIDLDHFKDVNDLFGHAAGDAVLKSVAQCLRRGLRAIDILGRYGGEEFIIFLPETDLETARQVAGRICTQLAAWSTPIEGTNLQVTGSFGVHALKAGPGATLDDLLKGADLALYQAKANGRNQVAVIIQ